MKLISEINNSGIFAQSAISASISTKDSLGRDITATYLTEHQTIPSAKWEDTSDLVQSNSAKWNEIEEYETNSASYLTAHQDISDKLDTTAFSTVSGTFLTAHQDLSNYATTGDLNNASSTLSGAIDYISGVAITAHQDITNKLDTTAFSTVSGTFLTAHQSLEGYLTKNSADTLYQPIGSYASQSDLEQVSGSLDNYVPYSATELGIGIDNGVTGGWSLAIGSGNTANTGISLGLKNEVTGYGVGIGQINTAHGSVAIGRYNNAAIRSVALGINASANTDSFAILQQASAYDNSIAMGYSARAEKDSIAIGDKTSAYYYAIALGENSTAANHSIAINGHAVGSHSIALDGYAMDPMCIAVGFQSKSENSGIAVGTNLKAGSGTMVFGSYNYAPNSANGGWIFANGKWGTTADIWDEAWITPYGGISARWSMSGLDYVFATGGNTGINSGNSANLRSLYATVKTNSSTWGGGGTSLTGDAQGAVDEVYSNSADWNSNYSTVNANSSTWNNGGFTGEVYGISGVSPNVDVYIDQNTLWISADGGGDVEVNDYVYNNSATIDEVNTTVQTNSAIWSEITGVSSNYATTGDLNTTSSLLNNQVTALRNDLNTVSTNTGYLYNDLQTTSGILSGAIDYVSANLPEGFTGINHDNNLSGDGNSIPLGLASSIKLQDPSIYTTATYGGSVSIDGIMPRLQLKTNNSSYNTLGEGGMTVTHPASSVGGGYTTCHYGEKMSLSYNDGDYYLHTMDTTKSGLGVTYKGAPNVKAYYNYSGISLTNDNGATNEYVNVASIRNWNDVYDTVETNSGSWTGGGGGSIDTIPVVAISPLVTGFSGESAYLGIESTALNLSSYVPVSAIGVDNNDCVNIISGKYIYAVTADYADYAYRATYDGNWNDIASYYQPALTIAGDSGTITSINGSAVGASIPEGWELVGSAGISIYDDSANNQTIISVTGGGGDLSNYYTKTETSSKIELDNAIGNIETLLANL